MANPASANQIAFGLFLPGAEMMLAASRHSIHENECQMLFQHLDCLGSGDLLQSAPALYFQAKSAADSPP